MNNHEDQLNSNDSNDSNHSNIRHSKVPRIDRTGRSRRHGKRVNIENTDAGGATTSRITGSNGYLLRNRPGWDVPVGREAALLLSEGVWPRETAILEACEQLGVVTVEQVARAFFNNPRSAYTQLHFLASRRFLARIQVDRATIRLATATAYEPGVPGANGQHGTHSTYPRYRRNPAYILDWNGYYLLTEKYGYRPRNWDPSIAGVVTSRFGHSLGISEMWSYLVAAARATHELDLAPYELQPNWGRIPLQIGFLNERECHLSHERAGLRYAPFASKAALTGLPDLYGDEVNSVEKGNKASSSLLRPDGCLVVGIVQSWQTVSRGEPGVSTPVGNKGRKEYKGYKGYNRYSPRWDPTLHSWESALLPSVPTPDLMLDSEKAGDVAYRSLLLEMETGSNHQKELIGKVTAYNRVIRQHSEAWNNAYGIAPRVLVVVRDDSQIRFQARLWRTYSVLSGETSVLLTSLQTLGRVCAGADYEGDARCASDERRALIDQPCWLDVMAREQPTWKTLGEALYITEERGKR